MIEAQNDTRPLPDDLPKNLPADPAATYVPPSVSAWRGKNGATGGRPASTADANDDSLGLSPPIVTPLSRWSLSIDPEELAEEVGDVETVDPGRSETETGPQGVTVPGADRPAFRFTRFVARGGMGEIWEARQESLGRRVAVKRIRRDYYAQLSSEPAEQREATLSFRQEAVTTALLEHPNIVPVHDLGADPEGLPLLAMKLVKGRPWDALLKEDFLKLSAAELLGRNLPILVSMAQAVAFAHARGILHRDLKPGQVMVGEFGETLLMDWGLAVDFGATSAEESDESGAFARAAGEAPFRPPSLKDAANPAGTPALMAPEQTMSTSERLGPCTDVYLLGATLYFLLTGTYPHRGATSADVVRRAREGKVEAPSLRAPGREIPIELEQLAMKALAIDPADRVASALAFVEGVQDYLTGASRRRESEEAARQAANDLEDLGDARAELAPEEVYAKRADIADNLERALRLWPGNEHAARLRAENLAGRVQAEVAQGDLIWARLHLDALTRSGPAGVAAEPALRERYDAALKRRTRIRRQRVFFAGSATVLAILALIAAWRWSLARADASEARAREALVKADASRERAERLAAEERAKRESAERQEEERLKDLFIRLNKLRQDEDALAVAMERELPLPKELGDQVAEPDPAKLERAQSLLAARRELLLERSRLDALLPSGAARASEPFALLLGDANLAYLSDATVAGASAALELYQAANASRPELYEPLVGMALSAFRAGHPTSAAAWLDEALAVSLRENGPDHPDRPAMLALAADAYAKLDESAEARTRYRDSISILEPKWLYSTTTLADRYYDLGEYDQSRRFARLALDEAGRVSGERSVEVADVAMFLAHAQRAKGQDDESEANYRLALAILGELRERGEEPIPGMEIKALSGLGTILADHERFEEAEEVRRRSLEVASESFGPEGRETLGSMGELATLLLDIGQFGEAERLLTTAAEAEGRLFGRETARYAKRLYDLGLLHMAMDRVPEAAAAFAEALAISERYYGVDHPDIAPDLNALATALQQGGRHVEAEAMLRRAIAIHAKARGERNPVVATAINNLGNNLRYQQRFDEAEGMYRAALAIDEAAYGPVHSDVSRDLVNLAGLYLETQRFEEAEPLARRALAIVEEVLGENHPDIGLHRGMLAGALFYLGRVDEAEALHKQSLEEDLRLYGEASEPVMRHCHNLGALLHQSDRAEEAVPWFQRQLDIAERLYGENDPRLERPLFYLARPLRDLGRLDEAISLLRRVLAVVEASYGPDSAVAASYHMNLCDTYAMAGRLDEAIDSAKRAREIMLGQEGEHDNMYERILERIERLEEARAAANALPEEGAEEDAADPDGDAAPEK